MNLIDSSVTSPFVGTYIGLAALVLVNIFIAQLSATFTRVYDQAEAYIIFQRAIEILNKEKSMTFYERRQHVNFLREKCNPYLDKKYNEVITNMEDKITNLEHEIRDQRKFIAKSVLKSEFD